MRSNCWKNKELEILKEHYPVMENPRDLLKMINRPYCAIKTKAQKLGLKRQFHTGPWTPEREQKLISLYPTTTVADLAKILNVTESGIIGKAFKLGLRKDPAFAYECSSKGFYKKGETPVNKGRKMTEWMSAEGINRSAATRFKKGNIAKNYRPVGSERISKDGYTEIKVADPNKWDLKHRVIYEQGYGPISDGVLVKFKDGDKLNLDPENLYLCDKVENMKANTYHNYPKEIAQVIQLGGALKRKINNKRKKLSNEK